MDAKEARRKALEIVETKNTNQLCEIRQKIEKAVKDGQFYINYYYELYMDVKDQLKVEGFNIHEHSDQKDGITITITW